MLLDLSESQDAWVELQGLKKLQVSQGSTVELLDSGAPVVTLSDAKKMIYAPHAWSQVTVIDKYALAANILLANSRKDMD
jgi:hypothetical protein